MRAIGDQRAPTWPPTTLPTSSSRPSFCLLFFSSLPFLSYAGAISKETVACLIRSVQMIGTHYASQQLRGRLSPFTRLPILHRKP